MFGMDRTNWLTNLIIIQIYSFRIVKYFYSVLKGVYSLLTNTSELSRICYRKAKELKIQDQIVEITEPINNGDVIESPNSTNDEKDPQFEEFFKVLCKLSKDTRLDAETLYRMDLCILHSTELDDFRYKFESWYTLFDRDPMIYVEPGQGQKFKQLFKELAILKHFPIKPTIVEKELVVLHSGLSEIFATMQLLHELNSRASTRYDVNQLQNEEKLMELWNALTDEKLQFRFTKQWQKIGFQGSDPSTDFRAMGMLALDNLHYFATKYKS